MNEENKNDVKANKKTALLAAVAMVLLLVSGWLYHEYLNKQPHKENIGNQGNDTTATDSTGTTASGDSAISSLNTEIKNNPNDPNLFVEKSNLLYNSGDKEGALDAVNEGLISNPDSDILKNKKDVLEKDYFQSSSEDTPRQ